MNVFGQGLDLNAVPGAEALRARAFEFVVKRGLPTKREEDWRYTSLKALADEAFVPAQARDAHPSHATMAQVAAALTPEFYNIVFVNGRLDRTLSSLEDLPAEIGWSADVAAGGFDDVMEALSVVHLGQGLALKIAADASLDKPLRVHFHTSPEGGPALMVSPRLSVDVGARASVTLIESYGGEAGARYFVNAHTEIATGTSAQLAHVRVQEESLRAVHVGRTRLRPAKGSEVLSLSVSTGAALCRQNLDAVIDAEGVSAKILGAVAAGGDQHVDNATEIDHRAAGTTSLQTYKSLLDGRGRSVFSGRIRIRPDAQKVASEQLSQSLLLSETAEADTRPQLMIEADDVKAAHGATVGQLSAEELFYLMSRGVPRAQAEALLSAGFLASVVDHVPNARARDWVNARIAAVLPRLRGDA